MSERPISPHLLIALVIALMAHALLLYAAWQAGLSPEQAQDEADTMSIALEWVQTGQQAQPPDAPKEAESPAELEPTLPDQPGIAAKPIQSPAPEAPGKQVEHPPTDAVPLPLVTQAQGAEPPAPPASASQMTIESAYLAGLREAIMQHRQYPRSAQRKRQEGTTNIGFILDGNGNIHESRIVHSSGFRALDKAALRAVRDLRRYKPIPAELHRERWPLSVNLEFTLH